MKLLISEKQYRKLFEARMEGFRLDYLKSSSSFNERLKYCKKMLGYPIGRGSSRIVFQIDDETCLKLALNKKGVAQNLEEIKIARKRFIQYIPKIYNGSDEDNGLWVITQYVLPAKKSDFKKVLNMDFGDMEDYARNIDRSFANGNSYHTKMADNMIHHLYAKYENNDAVIELFNDMHDLKANYSQIIGDLTRIKNWGMVSENGNTYIVMLDTGCSEEIFNQFYRRM
jgi:hypothetical protein